MIRLFKDKSLNAEAIYALCADPRHPKEGGAYVFQNDYILYTRVDNKLGELPKNDWHKLISPNVTVRREFERECGHCGGEGFLEPDAYHYKDKPCCPTCHGTGKQPCERFKVEGGVLKSVCPRCREDNTEGLQPFTCPDCDGGWAEIRAKSCSCCDGGKLMHPDTRFFTPDGEVGYCPDCKGTGHDPDWTERWGKVWEAWEKYRFMMKPIDIEGDICALVGDRLIPCELPWRPEQYLSYEFHKNWFDTTPELHRITLQLGDGPEVYVEREDIT